MGKKMPCTIESKDHEVSGTVNVSVVVPVYRNAPTLPELTYRVSQILSGRNCSFELIFVNDASPDDSAAVLQKLALDEPNIVTITMQENVGQHRAVLAGLRKSRGQAVLLMDADLQDPPESIPALLNELDAGVSAAFAGRRGAYQSRCRMISSRIFKRLLSRLCGVPRDAGMFVALNRQMVDRVIDLSPPIPFVVAMIGCTGLPTTSIPVARSKRTVGSSAYSAWNRLQAGLRAVACVVCCKLSLRGQHRD